MLGARIDVVQPPILNFIAHLLPLPDKNPMTAVVKRDKTSGLLLWIMVCVTRLTISCESHDYVVYEIMSVCVCVKQQTDDLYA